MATEDRPKQPVPRPVAPFASFANVPPPEPFHRTKEFKLFLRMAGALVLVGVFGLVMLLRTRPSSADVTEGQRIANLPRPVLTAEEKAERATLLYSKFEGALKDSENGDDFRQTPGYWKLLETLIHFGPEEIAKRTTHDLTWAEAMADPDAWRGEFVRVRGIVGDMWALKLGRPILNRGDVWRAQLSDGDDCFYFDLTEKPEGVDFKGEAVDIEGIFYRTVRFKSNQGQIELPYLLVRNIRLADTNATTGIHLFMQQHSLALMGGMLFVISCAALLIFWIGARARRQRTSRPSGETFQALFDKKLREAGRTPPPPQ